MTARWRVATLPQTPTAVKGWDETEQKGTGRCEAGKKREHWSIERDFLRARKVAPANIAQKRDACRGEHDAPGCGRQGNQGALGQEVANDACARGAQRGPYGKLAAATRNASHEQAGAIRTSDQPHERDGCQRQYCSRADITRNMAL